MSGSPPPVAQSERSSLLDGGAVPPWLNNSAALGWRLIAIALFAGALLLLVKLLWIVAASIAVGVVVAAVFAPAVTALRARGHSRNGAALIVWAAAFGAIALAVLVLAIAFVPYLVQILTNVDAGLTQLQTTLSSYSVPPVAGNVARDLLGFVVSSTGVDFGAILASIGAAATVVILAVFLIFFLLRDGDDGWRWAFQALGDDDLEGITDAGRVALVRVGGYLRGTTVLSAIIATTDYVFMLVLGTPLALSLAMLVFLGGYIPYFGGLVTSAIILLATYAAQGPTAALALLVLIAIRNLIVGYGIRPALYGKVVKIHPAIVLLALPAGFELAGVIGLFAAVPVTAVFLAVARAVVDVLEPDK
jgi:predicted PurR-regulated permease PerM